MQVLVVRAGLTLNPGQMADLVLAWRQVVGLLGMIPRDRPMLDDQALVFRLPSPAEPAAPVGAPAELKAPGTVVRAGGKAAPAGKTAGKVGASKTAASAVGKGAAGRKAAAHIGKAAAGRGGKTLATTPGKKAAMPAGGKASAGRKLGAGKKAGAGKTGRRQR